MKIDRIIEIIYKLTDDRLETNSAFFFFFFNFHKKNSLTSILFILFIVLSFNFYLIALVF